MGHCWCKQKQEENETYVYQTTSNGMIPFASQYCMKVTKPPDPQIVDKLILDTLGIIATLVDNEQDPPSSMLMLHNIADNEEGFIQVVKSMINVVPLSNPLGPSIITLLLDDCPLPSKECVLKVVQMLNLSRETAIYGRDNPLKQRNVCIVLGCIAETLAGPRNLDILTDNTLEYLLTNLNPEMDPNVILFSLIALEKFAQSSQNKSTIFRKLKGFKPCPISILEKWSNERDYVKRQVGFCAQWILDNLFVTDSRKYSYLSVNMEGINAMLNTSDVSEYLKISPDGLEARCDAYSFESVRCTAQADSGVWYYEVLIITSGVMQIGWATKNSSFLNHARHLISYRLSAMLMVSLQEGYGIGDDIFSLAYDGCRQLVWYNAKSEIQSLPPWKPGDILGCLLNLDRQEIVFSINGVSLPPYTHVFTMTKNGFFAAASFMSFQQCRFNFGAEPFHYPPNISFATFNGSATLKPEDKVVLPRHIFLRQLREQKIGDDCCTICYDKKASVRLIPCEHSGFCSSCASQLVECPMCRAPFELVLEDSP